MVLSAGWELTSVYESNDRGKDDVSWIRRFADEGGHAILSADTDFIKTAPQVVAIFDTGLKIIHLPSKWGNAKAHLQAAHLLQWWNRIENMISNMKPSECYRPEWNIRESGELKRVKIDFQKAQKKEKRAARQRTA